MKNLSSKVSGLYKSIWLFPLVLLIPVIILTGLGISGSSIGVYHKILNLPGEDSALIAGQPRLIRSDEWVVNSQMTIAQEKIDFAEVNPNIGNGQNMSITTDAPYRDWSALFKPHNLAFFVLPLENAFAFKWWLISYLLVVSCYFFILTILPKKRLLAGTLSLAFLFSPFLQWWYLFGTLGTLYYCLFGATAYINLLRAKSRKSTFLWALAIFYLTTCFALVLYPPFQVICALATISFLAGYTIDEHKTLPTKKLLMKLLPVFIAIFVAAILTLVFVAQRHEIVKTIQNTAYPGARMVESGGYDVRHLFTGYLDGQLLSDDKSRHYVIPHSSIANQSEASSFIFLWPFLIVPLLVFAVLEFKRKEIVHFSIISTTCALLLILGWMYIPNIDFLGKLLFINQSPHNRLIIGLGLFNLFVTLVFIKNLPKIKSDYPQILSSTNVIFITTLTLVFHVLVSVQTHELFPRFIGLPKALALSVVVPTIVLFLLKGRILLSSLVLLVFSIYLSAGVNPLYRGLDVLTSSPLSKTIQTLSDKDPNKRWVLENGFLENFAILNGAPSLSGVYTYPQMEFWSSLDPQGKEEYRYNRYAHVSINIDRNAGIYIKDEMLSPNADHFGVLTELCSDFLKDRNAGYAILEVPVNINDQRCAQLHSQVKHSSFVYYIYKLH